MSEMFAEVIQAIATVGFPCVAAAYLAKLNDKQDERHRNSEKELIAALGNNTTTLAVLAERLGKEVNERN